jgi:DNA-binding CsgD family transcriptional regulator
MGEPEEAAQGDRAADALLLRDADVVDLEQRVSMTATWAWLPASDTVVWSPNFFRLLGHEPGAFQPTQERFAEQIHPLDLGHVDRLRPTSYPSEYRVIRPDDTIRFFHSAPAAHRPAGHGLDERWVGVVQDLTDFRRSDATLHAHEAVTETLAEWTSLQLDGERLLHCIAARLGCFRAALYVQRGALLFPIVFWDDDEAGPSQRDKLLEEEIRPGQGITGRAWSERQPVCAQDLLAASTVEGPWRRLVEEAKIRGCLALPLSAHDRTVAVATFASHDVLDPSPGELRSLAALAHMIAGFFAQRPAELSIALLSERECQILQLAAEGVSGQQIAAELHISTETVKSHFKRIYTKLQVSDRAAGVAQAMRLGLIN